jgi:hypothetical protein
VWIELQWRQSSTVYASRRRRSAWTSNQAAARGAWATDTLRAASASSRWTAAAGKYHHLRRTAITQPDYCTASCLSNCTVLVTIRKKRWNKMGQQDCTSGMLSFLSAYLDSNLPRFLLQFSCTSWCYTIVVPSITRDITSQPRRGWVSSITKANGQMIGTLVESKWKEDWSLEKDVSLKVRWCIVYICLLKTLFFLP